MQNHHQHIIKVDFLIVTLSATVINAIILIIIIIFIISSGDKNSYMHLKSWETGGVYQNSVIQHSVKKKPKPPVLWSYKDNSSCAASWLELCTVSSLIWMCWAWTSSGDLYICSWTGGIKQKHLPDVGLDSKAVTSCFKVQSVECWILKNGPWKLLMETWLKLTCLSWMLEIWKASSPVGERKKSYETISLYRQMTHNWKGCRSNKFI